MLSLRKNLKPRFEQLIDRFMNERPLQGKTRKRTWREAVRMVCETNPQVYQKYLNQLKEIAKGEK